MATVEELVEKNGSVEGTLIGVDGNAFSVIAYTTGRLKKSDWPREDVNTFRDMCWSTCDSYEQLLGMCSSVLDF